MTICLFLVGNFWLAAALTLLVGCKVARTQPTMYAFFDVGGWYYPASYNTLVALCVAAAATCFVLSFRSWRRQNPLLAARTNVVRGFPVIQPTSAGDSGR